MVSFLVSGDGNITLIVGTQRYVVSKEHTNYSKIKAGLTTLDEKQLRNLLDVEKKFNRVVAQLGGGAGIVDNQVVVDGVPVHNALTKRILELFNDNFPVTSLLKFLENVRKNPSRGCVERLFDFLSYTGIPITEDGCFLAYKSVQKDFWSKTSGTMKLISGKTNDEGRIYNGVGEVIECERNEVDDNPNNHCSNGLHAGAWEYSGFGGSFNDSDNAVVIVKINPKDVVSVPTDYNAQKLRASRYEVTSVCEKKLDESPVYTSQNAPKVAGDNNEDAFDLGYQDGWDGSYSNPFDEDDEYTDYHRYDEGFDQGQDDYHEEHDNDCDEADESYYSRTGYSVDPPENSVNQNCGNCGCDLSKKPNGQTYYCGRDASGKFKKRGS